MIINFFIVIWPRTCNFTWCMDYKFFLKFLFHTHVHEIVVLFLFNNYNIYTNINLLEKYGLTYKFQISTYNCLHIKVFNLKFYHLNLDVMAGDRRYTCLYTGFYVCIIRVVILIDIKRYIGIIFTISEYVFIWNNLMKHSPNQ